MAFESWTTFEKFQVFKFGSNLKFEISSFGARPPNFKFQIVLLAPIYREDI